MNLFLNLTTRNKLFFGFGLMILLLVGVIAIAYRNIAAMQASQEVLYNRDFADNVDFQDFRAKNNRVRADLLTMMFLSQGPEQENWHNDIKQSSQYIDKLLQQLVERQREDPAFLGKLKDLKSLNDDYVRVRDSQEIPLIYAGKIKEAMAMALGAQSERYLKIRALVLELSESSKQRAQDAVTGAQQRADESRRIFGIIGIIALSLAVAMVLLLTRVIAGPLKEIAGIAERIASGDLSMTIAVSDRIDEVGVLMRMFARMLQSLQEMAGIAKQIAAGDLTVQVKPQSDKDTLGNAFAAMVNNLRKLTLEIRDGMNILASSSTEILATTTQVATGSAETATAVSETTATVEEVKQTVQLANQKAKLVSDSAQQVAKVSQTGRQAVDELIAGMDRIHEQTASAAESIVRLSEQSQVIGEIILTVNDLAEQSNLLAVNAAIEAAKAGDQGKGFAVVAQEIKSLAEQSKQATAQVRAILGDIQKATGAAVMATDLSGKAVDAGVQQSDAAGEAIRLLAESIVEAAQASLQIAASSQQQLVGMDQVALAMENIKQASTQNMAGTRQAEAAAQNLHELGLKLKQLVERYQL